jgi:hypothetical protein
VYLLRLCLRYLRYHWVRWRGVRYVQVRGYLKSLGSRYGSQAFLWVNVPVQHSIPGMHSKRGLGMGSVFPSIPWMVPENCRSEAYYGWGEDIQLDVDYYRARERGFVWLRYVQRFLLGTLMGEVLTPWGGKGVNTFVSPCRDVWEQVRGHLAVCVLMPVCYRGCWGAECYPWAEGYPWGRG